MKIFITPAGVHIQGFPTLILSGLPDARHPQHAPDDGARFRQAPRRREREEEQAVRAEHEHGQRDRVERAERVLDAPGRGGARGG